MSVEAVDQLLELDALDGAAASEIVFEAFIDPDEYELTTLDELGRLRPKAQAQVVRDASHVIEEETLVAGALEVRGDLTIDAHLVVLGDLTVHGSLSSGPDCCVIVLGSVDARALCTSQSYWLVDGTVRTSLTWLATMSVVLHREELRADLLIEEMHSQRREESGPIETKHHIAAEDVFGDETSRLALRTAVHPEALTGQDGEPDAALLVKTAAAGEPIVRDE